LPRTLRRVSSGYNYFQDPEPFLHLGGRRGKQLQVLTDGTFFINRWFATIEKKPKTLIPIGYVGDILRLTRSSVKPRWSFASVPETRVQLEPK
jgi:hypothetical protein